MSLICRKPSSNLRFNSRIHPSAHLLTLSVCMHTHVCVCMHGRIVYMGLCIYEYVSVVLFGTSAPVHICVLVCVGVYFVCVVCVGVYVHVCRFKEGELKEALIAQHAQMEETSRWRQRADEEACRAQELRVKLDQMREERVEGAAEEVQRLLLEKKEVSCTDVHTHARIHIHIYIYMYIYMWMCIYAYVCGCEFNAYHTHAYIIRAYTPPLLDSLPSWTHSHLLLALLPIFACCCSSLLSSSLIFSPTFYTHIHTHTRIHTHTHTHTHTYIHTLHSLSRSHSHSHSTLTLTLTLTLNTHSHSHLSRGTVGGGDE